MCTITMITIITCVVRSKGEEGDGGGADGRLPSYAIRTVAFRERREEKKLAAAPETRRRRYNTRSSTTTPPTMMPTTMSTTTTTRKKKWFFFLFFFSPPARFSHASLVVGLSSPAKCTHTHTNTIPPHYNIYIYTTYPLHQMASAP